MKDSVSLRASGQGPLVRYRCFVSDILDVEFCPSALVCRHSETNVRSLVYCKYRDELSSDFLDRLSQQHLLPQFDDVANLYEER